MSQKDKYTILIVDDEQADLKLLSALIDRHGYRFATALDGLEAIEKTKEIKPDLILLDILMPVMNGIEACKRLKEDPDSRHIPVIFLTSLDDKGTRVKCLEAGANDFLAKPVDNSELITRIRNLLLLKEFEDRNKILTEKIQAIEAAKKMEEEIRLQNEFLKTIIDSFGYPFYVIDTRDYTIKIANKATNIGNLSEKLTCYKFTHKRDKPCKDVEHPCPIEIIKDTKKPVTVEHVHYGNNGNARYFEVHGYPIFDEEGNVIQMIEYSIDITERRQAEEELKASQIELLKKNEELKDITESLEIINLAIEKERMDLQFAIDDISHLLKQVADNKDFGVRFSNPDTVTSGHVLKVAELFNNMMDILESQHKELEKAYSELKSAQSQILQSEKMASIGQLAAGVAHEINNPVGFIMSNLTSLLKYSDKLSQFIKVQSEAIGELGVKSLESVEIQKKVDEFKKSLKIDYIRDDINNLIKESLDGVERVKKIVQDLKSFSRVDEAEWKITDINEGMESTINIVWNELKYKATVKKEYGDIPLTKCNPGQMNQVFMNILVNAAHAIEKQGEITIKTWYDSGYIYISISDTGKGIPPENLNRIFEPFFTTKEVGKGTGLGLSIAYDIARKHNGDIIVKSEFGKGTTFTVKIPVVER